MAKLKCIKSLTLLLSLPFHEDHGMKQNKSKTNHDYCAFESFGLSRACSNVWTACVILIKKRRQWCQVKIQEETCKRLLSTASTVQTNENFLFFFIFIWAVIRCQDVCNWAISNRHLTLRGNRSTDGKQNLLVSFKHTVFSFSISFITATQHLLRVVIEVFEKPFSFFQVGKFNPYNSSCLASYNTCIYYVTP